MALNIQSSDRPIIWPNLPSTPSRRRTSELGDLAFISSTFFDVTPSASAAMVPFSTQRTMSCQRADARGVGIAAALVVGRDGVVVLLEVDDGDLEAALAEPVGRGLLLGRSGGDADRGVGQVLDRRDLGLGAHDEGLALAEIDALEVHAERGVAR